MLEAQLFDDQLCVPQVGSSSHQCLVFLTTLFNTYPRTFLSALPLALPSPILCVLIPYFLTRRSSIQSDALLDPALH